MIKIDQMVTLTIGECDWIGQVVDIKNEVALIQLYENMHYHAPISELTPLKKEDRVKENKNV